MQADELTFVEGATLEVFTRNDDGWWHGCVAGTRNHGVFPGKHAGYGWWMLAEFRVQTKFKLTRVH